MPAGYAATTGVESHLGDRFAYELSDLRVAERLPSFAFPQPPVDVYVEPSANLIAEKPPGLPGSKQTRRPSNIVPIDTDTAPGEGTDMFYLGLDLTFVGTDLGEPGMPDNVDVEVKFFLEAYGVVGEGGRPERHEINIAPQIFRGLNANPSAPAAGGAPLRHQLWVQVAEENLPSTPAPSIIEAPVTNPPNANGEPWNDLFTPGTVYKIAASVQIVDCVPIKYCPCIVGFLEGAVMNTFECPKPHVVE